MAYVMASNNFRKPLQIDNGAQIFGRTSTTMGKMGDCRTLGGPPLPGSIFTNSIKLMVEGHKFTLPAGGCYYSGQNPTLYQEDMLEERAKITL